MLMLILGVALFAGVHFIPSLAPSMKAGLQQKIGDNGYKGVFSLLLLASFALMILGWKSATTTFFYVLPDGFRLLALGLIAIALWLLVVSNRPSRLCQVVRHPQLTGVAVWAVAHLLVNGDSRSLVLFGGLLLWTIGEIVAINRREGVWIKDGVPGWGAEVVNIVLAVAVYGVLVFLHPWLSGVPII
ncbi:MAG: NnrU family protein [Halioglobus sp.]